jgi:hypothetical protein
MVAGGAGPICGAQRALFMPAAAGSNGWMSARRHAVHVHLRAIKERARLVHGVHARGCGCWCSVLFDLAVRVRHKEQGPAVDACLVVLACPGWTAWLAAYVSCALQR